jgi:hypothetical protein
LTQKTAFGGAGDVPFFQERSKRVQKIQINGP